MKNDGSVDIGAVRWAREVKPLLAATKRRGFVARLVRELNRVSQGRQWHRQQVDRYLHPEADKRREPLAGLGLVLLDAGRRAIAAMDATGSEKTTSRREKGVR